jgi:sporulation protein YlmC with PRC-barrel domain
MEPREVLTTDGRVIGNLLGGWIDPSNWTVSDLVIELDKRAVEELAVKKHALRSSKVRIPTSRVKIFSDVVQLDADIGTLSGSLIEMGKKG